MRRWAAAADTKLVVAVTTDGQVTIGPQCDDVDDFAILIADPPRVSELRGTVRTR